MREKEREELLERIKNLEARLAAKTSAKYSLPMIEGVDLMWDGLPSDTKARAWLRVSKPVGSVKAMILNMEGPPDHLRRFLVLMLTELTGLVESPGWFGDCGESHTDSPTPVRPK